MAAATSTLSADGREGAVKVGRIEWLPISQRPINQRPINQRPINQRPINQRHFGCAALVAKMAWR